MALPDRTDVFVVGGGPAGLAAALAARQAGFAVVLADRAPAHIDKACGEGLMPDALAALRQLGVVWDPDQGGSFRGIRFLDGGREVSAAFPHGLGLGLRRPILHGLLIEAAQNAGVTLLWQTAVDSVGADRVMIAGQSIRCRWIVAADGIHSRMRKRAGLAPGWSGQGRYGLRRHFRVEPWTDFVEVHWHQHHQAYITPIGAQEVCVALIGGGGETRFEDLLARSPRLVERLRGAVPSSAVRGALSVTTRLAHVVRANLALLGDASGSVDAITGEGMASAFRQALLLAQSLTHGDLAFYQAGHARIGRLSRTMARTLLFMGRHERLRHQAMRLLAARPAIFEKLLSIHVGGQFPSPGATMNPPALAHDA